MNNKLVKFIIILLILLSLFSIFIGIGYSFFTMNNNMGSTAEIINTSGKMTITYADGGSKLLLSERITPSEEIIVDKTFTLTGVNNNTAGDGLPMYYKIGIKYDNEFSGGMIHYYIKNISNTNGVSTSFISDEVTSIPGHINEMGFYHGTLKNGKNIYDELIVGEFGASNSKQTIMFNLKLQFPDNGENQSKEMGKHLDAEIVVNYELSFADDSWDEIAANVRNGYGGLYKVGSTKIVNIDENEYTLRIANNTTPDECKGEDFSETACGFVVEFVDIVENRSIKSDTSSNRGSWPATELRTYANEDFFNKLPIDLQNIIIEIKVMTGYGWEYSSRETDELFIESKDKIYLFSYPEIYSGISGNKDSAYKSTRQLDYYKAKSISVDNYNNSTIKKYNGTGTYWWLRQPFGISQWGAVRGDGNMMINGIALLAVVGFAPAFRIG